MAEDPMPISWDSALEARSNSGQTRALLPRSGAMEKARAFLRDEGRPDVPVSASPNSLLGLWIVVHEDPNAPDDRILGDGPLIVPTEGPAYWANGSMGPWPEWIGAEEPELWRWERESPLLGGGWDEALAPEFDEPYWYELLQFLAEERGRHNVYPPPSLTFRAFELTPFDEVKVVILGQDPYPNPGEAHGLAFSVPRDRAKKPPSLRNIHRVLEADMSEQFGSPFAAPSHGSLEAWSRQGVLLLNTALTVRAGSKSDRATHRTWRGEGGKGWSTFTDAVIRTVNEKNDQCVFILWGRDARAKVAKQRLIDHERHGVITSSHPSPFSAWRGFLDSRPFTETNDALGPRRAIDWAAINAS